MSIYLDNSATSHPKPERVYRSVEHALRVVGASPGRASHRLARDASAIVASTRSKVARFFGVAERGCVIFTKSATESINVALKGLLCPHDRVVTSSIEHNAVMRPLKRLRETLGVVVEKIPCGTCGEFDLDELRRRLRPPPKLVVLNHASNVNGALLPAVEIARICSESGVPLLLDAAQTAGIQPIKVDEWNLAMLACSAHKGLLGPAGVGVLYVRPDLNILPLMEGGTGSRSEDEEQPSECPERFESGTLNLPGIAGLGAGIDFIMDTGMDSIREHELELAAELERKLAEMPGVDLLKPVVRGTSAVSFTVRDFNPADLGYLLDQAFDIAVRTGLHCAPAAHKTFGTFPEGSVRVSPGFWTTKEDIEQFFVALETLLIRRS